MCYVSPSVWAQPTVSTCGTQLTETHITYREANPLPDIGGFLQRGALVYVPVQAHIIRQSDGSGGLALADLNNELDSVNAYYVNAGIYFFLCDTINYIDNDQYYDFNNDDESAMASEHDRSNVINVYFANTVWSSGGGYELCGYAYYPPGPDRIIMSNQCATNGSTLAHEFGHYFSLYHTHETGFGYEYVDGSNCSVAGDFLCDTPADPNLLGEVDSNCIYTGSDTDPQNDPYMPDEQNIMSYSRKSCRDLFSSEQYNTMGASLINDRSYLYATLTTGFSFSGHVGTVNFTDTSSSATGWLWDFGDGNTSNVQHPEHSYSDTGTYEVCLTSWNACQQDSVCQTVTVTCEPASASFDYNFHDTYTVNFINQSVNANTWFWDFGDNQLSAQAAPAHTYTEPGEYTVSLISSNICNSDTTSQTITVTSLNRYAAVERSGFQLHPNPVKADFYMTYQVPEQASVRVTIHDHLGRTVGTLQADISRQPGKYQEHFTLHELRLSSGVYYIRAAIGENLITRKLLVME